MDTKIVNPINIFYSYALEDSALRDELEKHLKGMEARGKISGWYRGNPGENWEEEIENHLNSAHIILLLVSPDYIYSAHHQKFEVPTAMKRHESNEACVIPILLRSINLQDTPFHNLYTLPTNKQPVTTWHDRDEAFDDIAQGIRRVVDNLNKPQSTTDHQQKKELKKQFSGHQEMVSELKSIHNGLHDLETVLEVLFRTIQLYKGVDERNKLLYSAIKNNWRLVQEKIEDLRFFSEQIAKFPEHRLTIKDDKRVGPSWIIDPLKFSDDFSAALNEQNTGEIEELSVEFLDTCRVHLQKIDRELLVEIEQVDQLSKLILRDMGYEASGND